MRLSQAVFRLADLRVVGLAYRWPTPPGLGAEVMLNSGGPRMTIVDLDGDNRTCAWRQDDGLVSEFDFSFRTLRPAA